MQPIQFFAARHDDGALLPNATIDVYLKGTQTRATLYADDSETPLGNPAYADAGARVFLYTPAERVDIQISKGGYVAPLMRDILVVDVTETLAEMQGLADQVAESVADAAASADAAAAGGEVYASTADALSNGVYSLDSLVVGSGGTDGTFALAFSGGAGSGAAGWFTVVSGAISAYEITSRGRGYTSAPTVSFTASSGLSGASATAIIGANRAVGQYFVVPSVSSDNFRDEYIVESGPLAAATGKSVPSSQAVLSVQQRALRHDADISELRGNDQISEEFAWAAHDEDGQVALGIRHDGTVFVNLSAEARQLIARMDEMQVDGDTEYQYALVDQDSRVALGVLRDGSISMLRDGEISADSIYNLDLVYGLLDQDGKIAFGVTRSGELVGNFPAGTTIDYGKIAFIGDSITEFSDFPLQIGEKLGAEVLKFGFGGCRMGQLTDAGVGPYKDFMCMYRLADMIASGDFTDLITAADDLYAYNGDDNRPQSAAMAATDWSTVDTIVIFFGTNDWTATDITLGASTDTDGTTFLGAINHTVSTISLAYPLINLLFVTPMWRARQTGGDGKDADIYANGAGEYLIEYVDGCVERAQSHKLPVLDLYRNSGINQYNHTAFLYDGLHPNGTDGAKRLASRIESFIRRTIASND